MKSLDKSILRGNAYDANGIRENEPDVRSQIVMELAEYPSIAFGLLELDVGIRSVYSRRAHQNLKAMKANKTDSLNAH